MSSQDWSFWRKTSWARPDCISSKHRKYVLNEFITNSSICQNITNLWFHWRHLILIFFIIQVALVILGWCEDSWRERPIRMPGHVKLGNPGEPDPDPKPYLIVSMEMKREDMLKAYDPKKSYWCPDDKGGYAECMLESDDGNKAVVMAGHIVSKFMFHVFNKLPE